MLIVIVGGGTVGTELAAHLMNSGYDVSLIEKDHDRCLELSDKMDCLIVEGAGTSPRALVQAGIADATMVLAVTSMDEVNIMVCGIAAQFGVETRIARIRSSEFTSNNAPISLEKLGVTKVIDPEHIMVRVINQIARIPKAMEVFSYHGGKILIARHIMTEGMPLLGKSLNDILQMAGNDQFLAVALKHVDGPVRIPIGRDILEVGDDVTTLFPSNYLHQYLELLGLDNQRISKAIVAGNGLTAIQLCEEMATWIESVTLIDWDDKHAQQAAERLNNVEVILGDPTERDILNEVNASAADLFVGAGRDTSHNIMSTLLAKSEGTERTIAISYEPKSNNLFRKIGVDHVLSPRRALAQEILDIIHRGRSSVELQLRDLDLESVELMAQAGSKITKAPLAKAWTQFKGRAIVGAVIRDGKAFIPRGDTQIQAADELVVIIKPKHINKIQSLFK
ncbi:MAG: Trk system potassium transporter TrkA [bacterium]|nr:Trk system potassium transporter TrkA [bacterium]